MSTIIRRLRRLKDDPGQALIEYILILPMVFLLIVNSVNFGGFFYAWITVTNAARAGADYAVLSGASINAPGSPSGTQINNIITKDISSLPNASSLVVNVCQTATPPALLGTCGSIPADPEPANYVLISVDVQYTYKPFIAVFSFPKLGVYLTLPATNIRKISVMRSIQ